MQIASVVVRLIHFTRNLQIIILSSPLVIVYKCSGICLSSDRKTIFKDFLANKAKFYVEPPKVRGTKVCSRHLVHMTKKLAPRPYMVKSFQKLSKDFLRNKRTNIHETWYVASWARPIIVHSNYVPVLTLTYCMAS